MKPTTFFMTVLGLALAVGQIAAQQRGNAQADAQPEGVRQVKVTEIPGVIAAGAQWKVAWQGTNNADGIVGTPDGGLLFAQEQPSQVSKLDKDDKVSVFLKDTHGTGSVSMDGKGRIYGAQRTCTDPGNAGRGITGPCTEPTKIAVLAPERKTLADKLDDGKLLGRLSDLVADKIGGVYFTSGGAFYVSPAGKVTSLGDNLRANGIMLSPDEKTLYVTNGASIVAFDRQLDGTLRNRRDFAKLEAGGNGDGMAVDAAGRLYVTSNPGVQVFSPEGKYLGLIPTPRGAITVAFSGPNKKTMYIVGGGALGADGKEFVTPQGVRNNAKTIFKIAVLAEGIKDRGK